MTNVPFIDSYPDGIFTAARDFFHAAYNLLRIRNGKFTPVEVFANGTFVKENGLFELRDSTNTLIDNGKYLVLWK